MTGLSKAINASYRRRGRIADDRAKQLTQAGMHSVGRDRVGWWEHIGPDRNVRAIRTLSSDLVNPGSIRMSELDGNGYAQMHPPHQTGYSVGSLTLASNKATSGMFMDAEYIRVAGTGSVEGGCGFGQNFSTAGDTYTQIVSLQPSLIDIPSDISLDVIAATNCSATVTEITNQKFNLNVTSTGGGAFIYEAHYKTIVGGPGPPPPPPGSGPVYGVDNGNHSTVHQYQGLDFVIMKATQGTGFRDPELNENFANAQAAGVEYGFYHYGDTIGTGAAQWAHFISVVSGLGVDPHDHCLSLDWELDGHMSAANGQQFINVGQAAGYKVGVYASEGRPYPSWGQDWRWVAHWGVPKPSIPYHVHQYGFVRRDGQVFDADRAPYSLGDLNAIWH